MSIAAEGIAADGIAAEGIAAGGIAAGVNKAESGAVLGRTTEVNKAEGVPALGASAKRDKTAAILPGATIGIFGGGQLGRMTAMAARGMGYRLLVLDPDPACPARFVVDECIEAGWDDSVAAAELARACDVVTLEIEQISAASMVAAANFAPVRPGGAMLAIIQNRVDQKDWLRRNGFPVGAYRAVASLDEVREAVAALGGRCFCKSATGGYDGRGQGKVGFRAGTVVDRKAVDREAVKREAVKRQAVDPEAVDYEAVDREAVKRGSSKGKSIESESLEEEVKAAWRALGEGPGVVEQAIELEREISVLVARSPTGEVKVYPAAWNHHEDQILAWSVMPAPLSDAMAAEASAIAESIANAFQLEGILAVEMFCAKDGRLLVNELAPRPHNSYHGSERACPTSQFEQLVRAVCCLPLGEVEIVQPAAIANLLGDLWLDHDGAAREPKFDAALAVPGVRLHLYEKLLPRKGRKMGHLSAVGKTMEEAVALVLRAKAAL